MKKLKMKYGTALAAALVLASAAGATTSGLSPATSACIKQAKATEKTCKVSASTAECKVEYDTALANCFAAGNGVTCATACVTAKTTCDTPALAAEKMCLKTCKHTEKAALAACQLTDPNCPTNVASTFLTCKKACTQAPASIACKTAFANCLAQCPNL